MKHRNPKVLYFSLDDARTQAFWDWVKYGTADSLTYKKNFLFGRATSHMHKHAADLLIFLEQYRGNLQSLHVIIDIESIPQEPNNDQIDFINNTVIQYPEVQFLFDKRESRDQDLKSILFPSKRFDKDIEKRDDQECIRRKWKEIKESINEELIEISWEAQEDEDDIFMRRIIGGFDNTFDASNLRYAIKFRKYINLKVDENQNFRKLQESRKGHLAICVEEEIRQNIVNSYALYANGYRVLPISMRKELKWINDEFAKQTAFSNSSVIVVRDYDLQFEDEDGKSVDEIRGYKFIRSQKELDEICKDENGQLKPGKEKYKLFWNDFSSEFETRPNHYWSNLIMFPVFFVSKVSKDSHAEIVHPNECSKAKISVLPDNQEKLVLPGFSKPVCGIYSPLHGICAIGRPEGTYQESRYSKDDIDYPLKTYRKDHDHSTPLAIYEMVDSMIRRAESYYEQKRYLLAALVSGEAIEVLNGFHHRLMIKAYFIQSKAENAIAMDVVGGNEQYLAKDATFRVNKISEDIERFYQGYEKKSSRNVLNQIFSDCRLFCKDNEHFESEDVFLSAMGHLIEGYSLSQLFDDIKKKLQSIRNNEDATFENNDEEVTKE